MSKKAEKEQALNLRKRGFTLREIAKYTNVSVSTVSLWLKDASWSEKITEDNQKRAARDNAKRISLLNAARAHQYKKLYGEAERSAVTEYKHFKSNPLFLVGITLYFVRGDQHNDGVIRFSTSKIDEHVLFQRFIREFLGVERKDIRFWLLLYPTQKPLVCSRIWSKKLHLPLSQFHKYQVIQGRSTKCTLHSGVGNTIIGGTVLKKKLATWIKLALKELK